MANLNGTVRRGGIVGLGVVAGTAIWPLGGMEALAIVPNDEPRVGLVMAVLSHPLGEARRMSPTSHGEGSERMVRNGPSIAPDIAASLRHRVFGGAIDLQIEPGRIAVVGRDASPALPTGAVLDAAAPALPPEWQVWRLDDDLGQLLATRKEILFATPFLRCAEGHWRIPTRDLLLRTHDRLSDAELATLLADHGLDAAAVMARDEWGLDRLVRLRPSIRDGISMVRLADRLADDPRIRFAEPDFLMAGAPGGQVFPSDPFFPDQWGFHNTNQPTVCLDSSSTDDVDVNAPEAWALVQGSPDVIVLVIDNGVEFGHPDMLDDPSLGFDPTPGNGGGEPVHACDSHGTPVAGLIVATADNGLGIAGLAHGVRFASARISMVNDSCSIWTVQPSWVASSLSWGEQVGARISNTSWRFTPSATIADAYAARADAGMLHFASSGNQTLPSVSFPARLPSVVAVGALRRDGELASFSNWGIDQELVAPGVGLLAPDRVGAAGYSGTDYTCFGGTSAAAPMAAGVAALMLSANPQLGAEQMRLMMQQTATDLGTAGWDQFFGHGLVRADAAVLAALDALHGDPDLDGNGVVDGADLALLLGAWGSAGPLGDLNADGVVDGADLGVLLGFWGAITP